MNNIIHDQLSCVKKVPVIIQKFDYKQMFDGMDSEEACGDIFDYGVNDDHLTMIHEANTKIAINVKTPQGVREPYTLIKQNNAGGYLGSSNGLGTSGLFWKRNAREAIQLHVHVEL